MGCSLPQGHECSTDQVSNQPSPEVTQTGSGWGRPRSRQGLVEEGISGGSKNMHKSLR